ncbi:MAG: GTP-binding protein 10 [Marteilia pararefringens]
MIAKLARAAPSRSFIDKLLVTVRGGTGGAGKESRGGVGGAGGDVYGRSSNFATFEDLSRTNKRLNFVAGHGVHSTTDYLVGKDGEDIDLEIPTGTEVYSDEKFLCDLNKPNMRVKLARGGEGGNIKNDFMPCTGESFKIEFRLKMIADIGLVGFPNAGKSTLLSSLSQSRSKISPHPFTTLQPNLGHIVFDDARQISVADLPGLIEGAHLNRGLGIEFLRHLERNRLLLYLIDGEGSYETHNGFEKELFSPLRTLDILMEEVEHFNERLLSKPKILCINKVDVVGKEKSKEILSEIRDKYGDTFMDYLIISAKEHSNICDLKLKCRHFLDSIAIEESKNPNEASHKQTGDKEQVAMIETKKAKRNKRNFRQQLISLSHTLLV